eukprot:8455522-Alexandrium_andersonii.AAC.1
MALIRDLLAKLGKDSPCFAGPPTYIIDKLKWDETQQVASVLYDPLQSLRHPDLLPIEDAVA